MQHWNWNNQNPYWQGNWHGQRQNHNPQGANLYRRITIEEAMNIALQQVPGEIVKVELERKGDMLIYEVDIVTTQGVKYEVEIDTNTGEVIEVEID